MGDDDDSLALVFQHVRPEDVGLYTCVAATQTGNISCSAELTVQGTVHELAREPCKANLIVETKQALANIGSSAMLELQCKGFPRPEVCFFLSSVSSIQFNVLKIHKFTNNNIFSCEIKNRENSFS